MSVALAVLPGLSASCLNQPKSVPQNPAVTAKQAPEASFDSSIDSYRKKLFSENALRFYHIGRGEAA